MRNLQGIMQNRTQEGGEEVAGLGRRRSLPGWLSQGAGWTPTNKHRLPSAAHSRPCCWGVGGEAEAFQQITGDHSEVSKNWPSWNYILLVTHSLSPCSFPGLKNGSLCVPTCVSLRVYASCAFLPFVSFVLFWSVCSCFLLFYYYSLDICLLMREREGVGLDGSKEDLRGVGGRP